MFVLHGDDVIGVCTLIGRQPPVQGEVREEIKMRCQCLAQKSWLPSVTFLTFEKRLIIQGVVMSTCGSDG